MFPDLSPGSSRQDPQERSLAVMQEVLRQTQSLQKDEHAVWRVFQQPLMHDIVNRLDDVKDTSALANLSLILIAEQAFVISSLTDNHLQAVKLLQQHGIQFDSIIGE